MVIAVHSSIGVCVLCFFTHDVSMSTVQMHCSISLFTYLLCPKHTCKSNSPLQDQCNCAQLHLLSMHMEPILHGLCPLNCQDLLSWLPSNLAFHILSFLDPGIYSCTFFETIGFFLSEWVVSRCILNVACACNYVCVSIRRYTLLLMQLTCFFNSSPEDFAAVVA